MESMSQSGVSPAESREERKSMIERFQLERSEILKGYLDARCDEVEELVTPELLQKVKRYGSLAANFAPTIGNIKLAIESAVGVSASGRKLSPADRSLLLFSATTGILSWVLATVAAVERDADLAYVSGMTNAASMVMLGDYAEYREAAKTALDHGKENVARFFESVRGMGQMARPSKEVS